MIPGFEQAELSTLMVSVRGGLAGATPAEVADDAVEAFARAAWLGIAEPGDGVAGALIVQLGAARSLELLIARASIAEILTALRRTDSGATAQTSSEADPAAGGVADREPSGEETHRASWASGDERQHARWLRLIEAGIERWSPRLEAATAVRSIQAAARFGARLLLPADEHWPTRLGDLGVHAPIALWARGDLSRLGAMERSISLVGARASSGYGEHVAIEAASGLVDRGLAIISGGAYGIDGAAHRAALAANGVTIAVLAGGVDRLYPRGHEALLGSIVEHGLVLSELPCGASPSKWRFLQRNRLIAASGAATVVLEAGHRSGSLNTAGHAAALGRPLGAVPGPVTSAMSAGCHRLLREYGASCVTNAAEMAELTGLDNPGRFGVSESPPTRRTARTAAASRRGADDGPGEQRELNADETRVCDALTVRTPRSTIDVARRCGLSRVAVQTVIGLLELEGIVAERAGGWVFVPRARRAL